MKVGTAHSYTPADTDVLLRKVVSAIGKHLKVQPTSWDKSGLKTLAISLGTRSNPEKFHSGNDDMVDADAVLRAAEEVGIIDTTAQTRRLLYPTDEQEAVTEFESEHDIYSEPKHYPGHTEAIIVMGAAGLSILKRLYHAIKAIKTGAVDTNQIIIATGYRQVSEAEQKRITDAGHMAAETECGLCQRAITALTGLTPKEGKPISMSYDGQNALFAQTFNTVYRTGRNRIDPDRPGDDICELINIDITIVCAPLNPERKLENGEPATRVNTEESLIPIQCLLKDCSGNSVLYVVSHDIWQLCQMLVTVRCFPSFIITGSGPNSTDRIDISPATNKPMLKSPADVQDELRKVLMELIRLSYS